MLVVFGGLPGTGKSSIARELARQLWAVYLRIDSIEQAMRNSGAVGDSLDDAGYRVGFALAEDNLLLGRAVVADSVNPLRITRDAWVAAARRAQASAFEIEVLCSDPVVHRQRVETRVSEIAGLKQPTWQEAMEREYEPWNRAHLTVDTASRSVAECVKEVKQALRESIRD
jgi:predicted kinase